MSLHTTRCAWCFPWLAQEQKSHSLSHLCKVQMCHSECQKPGCHWLDKLGTLTSVSCLCCFTDVLGHLGTRATLCGGRIRTFTLLQRGERRGKTLQHRHPAWKRHVEENELNYSCTEPPLWLLHVDGQQMEVSSWSRSRGCRSAVALSPRHAILASSVACIGMHTGTLPSPVSLQTCAAGAWAPMSWVAACHSSWEWPRGLGHHTSPTGETHQRRKGHNQAFLLQARRSWSVEGTCSCSSAHQVHQVCRWLSREAEEEGVWTIITLCSLLHFQSANYRLDYLIHINSGRFQGIS